MGWLFKYGYTRKSLADDIIRQCGDNAADSSLVGNNLYVLYKCQSNGQPNGQLAVLCFKLQGGREDGWGYKDMDESMGPYGMNDCPKRIYQRSTMMDENAVAWRKRCDDFHAAKSTRAGMLGKIRKLKEGDVITLSQRYGGHAMNVLELSEVYGTRRGARIRAVMSDNPYTVYSVRPNQVQSVTLLHSV